MSGLGGMDELRQSLRNIAEALDLNVHIHDFSSICTELGVEIYELNIGVKDSNTYNE